MCNKVITKYSKCGHEDIDIFPCDKSLDEGVCPLDEPQIKENTNDHQLCHDCLERDHLESALQQIAEDEALRPVPRTAKSPRDPNAPKHYFIMREWFPWCGHYARYKWTDIEAEGDEDQYMDEQQYGSCYGCAEAHPATIKLMQQRGEWEGNPDPWGERRNITATSGSAGAAAAAPLDADSLIHPAFRDDHQGYESDDLYDDSPAKNKGVSGRPSRHVEENYDHPGFDDRHERGYSEDEDDNRSLSPPPRHPSHSAHYEGGYDSEPEDRLHGSRDATPNFDDDYMPPPAFQTTAPGGGAPKIFPGGPTEISEEDRKRYGLPAGLSNAQLKSILKRKQDEARDAMRQHSTGALDE